MSEPLLTLQHAAFAWPDGQRVFSDVDLQLDRRHTALVGRNGVGKSALARVLAGKLAPTHGQRRCHGRVYYVPQLVAAAPGASVADVGGVGRVLAALSRIEGGSADPADFDTVGERWDMRQQWLAMLAQEGLGHLAPEQPVSQLSGGELTRVALAGTWLQPADWLILDEPGNHLDAVQRERLRERLMDWPGGLLLVSHDRSLLADMGRTLELSAMGLADCGGRYAFYEQARDEAAARARQALEHLKAEQRRDERERLTRQENLARRQARTTRQGKQANQAAILLGGLRQASQVSAGKRLRELDQARNVQRQRIREAADRLTPEQGVNLLAPTAQGNAQRKIATLEEVRLPFGSAAVQAITLNLRGSPRLALTGANGSGKSSLLKLLAGQLAPASGRCHVHVPCALLDQQLQGLSPHASALQQLQAANPDADQAWLRTRLALLGLAGDDALKPSGQLSGGERLKAALACVLHARQPPELLLLDEPTNHLDLPSQQALEQMLGQYRGALIVASHDRVFLNRLQLDGRLVLGTGGLAVEYA